MKWWWSPWRKREWLRAEARYRDARWDLWLTAIGNPLGFVERQRICDALRPEGWTRDIENRRWNSFRPRARRWIA